MRSLAFKLLCLAVATYTLAGYVLIGRVPLYVLPLGWAALLLVCTPRFSVVDRTTGEWLLLFSLYLAWSLVATVAADELMFPVLFILGLAAGLLLFYVTYHSLDGQRRQRQLLAFFLVLHTAGLGLAILQGITGSFYPPPVVAHIALSPSGAAGRPSGFNGMIFMFGKNYLPLVGLGLGLLVAGADRHAVVGKGLGRVALAVGIAGVVLSGGRSTQLAVVVGLMAVAVRLRAWRYGVAVVALAAVMALFSPRLRDLVTGPGWQADAGIGARLLLTGAGLEIIRDHPLLGVGPGNFRHYYAQYMPDWLEVELYDVAAIDPHNVPLGIAVGMGLLGLALFLGLYAFAYRAGNRLFATAENPWHRGVGLGTSLYLLMFFIDSLFHNYFDDNNLWVFLGILFCSVREAARQKI